jgi:hypothetical protein
MAVSVWILPVALVIGAVAMSESPSHTAGKPSTRSAGITDVGTAEMLEEDMRMLERMRVAVSPPKDPMWFDSDMIQAQEQYQAQIDRMLARR